MYDLKPIPHHEFVIPDMCVKEINEELVNVADYKTDRIMIDLIYYKTGIPNATSECLMRKSVAEKLILAANKLPHSLCFKIYDAWRPFEVQQFLYAQFRKEVQAQHPEKDEKDIDFLTQKFVSVPQRSYENSPVHCTGGAIDLTLVNSNGEELEMGTAFDDFSPKSHTACFEQSGCDTTVRNNRRILYNAMIEEGFTNLPTEWWHFDYGDKLWAYYTDNTAFYSGIFK